MEVRGRPRRHPRPALGHGRAINGKDPDLHIPCVLHVPGRESAARSIDHLVRSIDFAPTLLDLAGLPAEPRLHADGASFAPGLRDPAVRPADRPIYWHYPHYSNQRGRPNSAMRDGRWKLIEWLETGRMELFDLSADPGEAHDLAAEHPDTIAALGAKLNAWRTSVGARMPTPNPNYRPSP